MGDLFGSYPRPFNNGFFRQPPEAPPSGSLSHVSVKSFPACLRNAPFWRRARCESNDRARVDFFPPNPRLYLGSPNPPTSATTPDPTFKPLKAVSKEAGACASCSGNVKAGERREELAVLLLACCRLLLRGRGAMDRAGLPRLDRSIHKTPRLARPLGSATLNPHIRAHTSQDRPDPPSNYEECRAFPGHAGPELRLRAPCPQARPL